METLDQNVVDLSEERDRRLFQPCIQRLRYCICESAAILFESLKSRAEIELRRRKVDLRGVHTGEVPILVLNHQIDFLQALLDTKRGELYEAEARLRKRGTPMKLWERLPEDW